MPQFTAFRGLTVKEAKKIRKEKKYINSDSDRNYIGHCSQFNLFKLINDLKEPKKRWVECLESQKSKLVV